MKKNSTNYDYQLSYKKSVEDPESFWSEIADDFQWHSKYDKVLEWNFEEPNINWFVNGKLNVTENCLDRHLSDRGDQIALIWEPNDPSGIVRKYTYRDLHAEVCRTANALRTMGVSKGDRVVFYMPMVPELAIGVLACARIGAVHSVVFAGFSAQALADRVDDAQAKMIICADTNHRGKKQIPVKAVVDQARLISCESVSSVIVYKNGEEESTLAEDEVWWQEALRGQSTECEAEVMDSEDMLFILYTSGSTGKPKGVVHTCGGYMVYTGYSFLNVFQYERGDTYWCTADIGWITGHSYIIYGPLLSGATTVMFEGVPSFPDPGRFWAIVEKHKVNQFYTAPTAIRALMAHGESWPNQYNLSSLKVLGSVGEPINEEAWQWYHRVIGNSKLPIADTWWQTETGGIMISPIPYATDCKPCFASYPLPGIQAVLLDHDGNLIQENEVEGLLCIAFPWPSIIRTTYGDHQRCYQTYFSSFKNYYFTGDGAKRDKDGRIRVIGRVDDVINVSGHRMGTAELENAINSLSSIVESAVVAYPHDIKGQGIYAYIVCHDPNDTGHIEKEIQQILRKEIGAIAKLDFIQIVSDLPKTRSGKIMRRILRKIACNEISNFGDTSTLLNPDIVEEIIRGRKNVI